MAVMVAVTDSPEGQQALATAVEEAERLGTSVLAVNLALHDIPAQRLPTGGVEVRVLERTGNESHADVVLRALAEHSEAERLVIGVKRRSKVGKLVLGSVSQTLILESPVPVLAVKLPS